MSSFKDKVEILAEILPDRVEAVEGKKVTLTEADRVFLGDSGLSTPDSSILLESPSVGAEVKAALAAIQDGGSGGASDPILKAPYDLPRALSLGSFPKTRFPPFPRKENFKHVSIPQTSLRISTDDVRFARSISVTPKGHTSHSAILSDIRLKTWEETARQGLESMSLLDTFFGAVLKTVFKRNEDGSLQVNQDVDPATVQSLVATVSENLTFSSHSLATLHANFVLARRDAVLADSTIPEESKSTVRALPFENTLFGSDMTTVVKSQAEKVSSYRTLAAEIAPRASKRPTPAASYQPGPSPSPSPAKRSRKYDPKSKGNSGQRKPSGSKHKNSSGQRPSGSKSQKHHPQ